MHIALQCLVVLIGGGAIFHLIRFLVICARDGTEFAWPSLFISIGFQLLMWVILFYDHSFFV